MAPKRTAVTVAVDGHELELSNLEKVLYPSGFTKGEVVDYYARIADDRAAAPGRAGADVQALPERHRHQGVLREALPDHRPEWVERRPRPRRPAGRHRVLLRRLAGVARVGRQHGGDRAARADGAAPSDLDTPRAVVFDFDPGPSTDIADCCEIALAVRDVLAAVGLEGCCKTSGSKGLQLYVPLNTPGVTHERRAEFALAVGQVLEKQLPKRVTTVMAKAVRPGKIFVDWSQNAHHKTTIAPYSLRARPEPTVSTPVTWDEVAACADGDVELRFEAADVLARVAEHGDLFAPVLARRTAPAALG